MHISLRIHSPERPQRREREPLARLADLSRRLGLAAAAACAACSLAPASPPKQTAQQGSPQASRGASSPSSGWTEFAPSADTRKVYVSSRVGDDANDGLSAARPKRSLAAGKALLRDRSPDWLLLERGGVWQEPLGAWKLSGRSPAERLLVSTYGDAPARPRLDSGAADGIRTDGGGGTPPTIDCIALVGLHFRADGYAGGGDQVGARLLRPGSHVLIEDCMFEAYGTNLVLQAVDGRHHDFQLRRSVIVDAYAVHGRGAHPQGLYAYGIDGLLVEQCLFDHNGWHASLAGAGPDVYSHNLYVDNGNSGVVVRENIIADAGSHGLQLRCGGSAVGNLFVRNAIALAVGGGNHPEEGGVRADVRDNVILDGKDIDAQQRRGWGLWFANIAAGDVRSNIVAHDALAGAPRALVLDGDHVGDARASIGVHALKLERNVFFDWRGGALLEGDARALSGIELLRNDFQEPVADVALIEHADPTGLAGVRALENRFHGARATVEPRMRIGGAGLSLAQWSARIGDTSSSAARVEYPDAQRGVESHGRSIGRAGTVADFLAGARAQSRASWNPDLTAAAVNRHVRAGFGLQTD